MGLDLVRGRRPGTQLGSRTPPSPHWPGLTSCHARPRCRTAPGAPFPPGGPRDHRSPRLRAREQPGNDPGRQRSLPRPGALMLDMSRPPPG